MEPTGTRPSVPPPPQGKTRRPWLLPAGIGVAALVIGVAIGQAGGSVDPATVAQESSSPTEDPGMSLAPPEPTEPPEPEYAELHGRDLELTLRVTESSCYGSAGGLVTVQVRTAIDETVAANLDPAVQWDVTYRISGDENGPIIGTFSIYPDGQYDVDEETVSTPTCATKPTITITDVEGF
jgi:hypothetical protein